MPRRSLFRRGDWLVAVGVAAYGQLDTWLFGPTHLVGPLAGLALSASSSALLLLWRRRHPLLVQMSVVAVTVVPWAGWGASESAAPLLALAVSTYAVGRHGRRPLAYLGIPVAVGAIVLQLVLDPLQHDLAGAWAWPLYGLVFWGAGGWMRQRQELEVRREAELTERQRAALAEERTRIARELHDILAHSLGVMVLQAEAAEEMLDREPELARRPLHRVQGTGRDALQEIRGLLALLRSDDGDAPGASHDGTDVGRLVARLRDAGLPVAFDRTGGEMPPETARAVYRVTQEALTNVVRHAGAVPARVRLSVTAEEVALNVENDGAPQAAANAGHGLIGMRERVAACGGSVAAGPRDSGGFAVRARFPRPKSARS